MSEDRKEFTDDMHNALMVMTGVRLAGHKMKMVHAGNITFYIEAKKQKGILSQIKGNPRRLMGAVVEKLEAGGFVERQSEGSDVILVQTEKRL